MTVRSMSGRAESASKSGALYGVGSGETTVTLNSRAMRVAVVFGTYPPDRNGGADFVARFAEALAGRDAEVHVLTSAGRGPEREEVSEGVTVHRAIDEWTLSEDGRGTLRRANELLRSEGVDVVHVLFPDSVLQGRYQLPAAIGLRRLPLVTTFWNLGLGRRSPASDQARGARAARPEHRPLEPRPGLPGRDSAHRRTRQAGALAAGRHEHRR